jgi:hypothetical protein
MDATPGGVGLLGLTVIALALVGPGVAYMERELAGNGKWQSNRRTQSLKIHPRQITKRSLNGSSAVTAALFDRRQKRSGDAGGWRRRKNRPSG